MENASLDSFINKEEKFNIELLIHNNKQIDKFLTIVYIIGGIISGILGFTGMKGFILFIIIAIFGSISLWIKSKCNLIAYTNVSIINLSSNGITNYGMSYILFWTLTYALIHIY